MRRQIKAGVDCIQVFDSWSGLLSPNDFKEFSQPYLIKIANALREESPVILFPKGSWYALEDLSELNIAALGIDWTIRPELARTLTQNKVTLQGNFDPNHLLKSITDIKKEVKQMIDAFGKDRYVVNLGHGILPNVPVDHAKAFVEAVKSFTIS